MKFWYHIFKKKLVSIFEIVKNDEDAIQHGKDHVIKLLFF
jgi:hypothetical protein